MATRSTERLKPFWSIFLREKYLFDYNCDERLVRRINGVLRRVQLPSVGSELDDWLPSARERVYASAVDLLGGRQDDPSPD